MMMTEKYCRLPPTPSSSFLYSTIYHTPTTKHRIHEIKDRLHSQKKQLSPLFGQNNMKLLLEQPQTIRTYSLYDVQDRIDYFEKKKLTDDHENNSKEKTVSHPSLATSSETLQSVIANTLQQTFFNHESYGSALSRTMMNSRIHDSLIGKRRSLSSSQLISTNDQKRLNRFYPSLSKRVRTYSLSNHTTMAIAATTTFSEEHNTEHQETNSNDLENTYFYPEETTRLDDGISLTTITSNFPVKIKNAQHDVSVCSDTAVSQSDTEENSEAIRPADQNLNNTYDINMVIDTQNENSNNNEEQIIRIRLSLTPPDDNFTGVVHAKKCTVVKEQQCSSDYGNVNHCPKQGNKIRSNIDDVSLNKSMTSSLTHGHNRRVSTDEQLSQQTERANDNENNDDVYCKANQQAIVHSIKMNNDIEMMIRQENDDDDGHYSDDSHYSDDLRYSSDAARNSCASDDLNNTSSTLRQEAISITRVRCKRRKTWIRATSSPTRSSTNNNTKSTSCIQQSNLKKPLIQPFLSNNQVHGTNARQNASVSSTITTKTATSTVLNQTRVKTTTAAMLLHNNSLISNNNKNKNSEALSYDYISLNDDYHSIKIDESQQLSKTTSTLTKDSSSSSKTSDFYRTSLSPVKRLLNESIDSNIEIIQMDEQECILEIVDGVLTIVPKEKSISSSIESNEEKSRQQPQIINYSTQHPKQRSSSVASSISTPSLSEHEQERDDLSSSSSSRLPSKPFILSHDIPAIKPSSPIPTEQSADVLDLYSLPLISNNNKTQKSLLDDSLSSVSSGSDRPIQIKKQQSNILRSSSPINNKSKSSSIKETSPSTVENQTHSNKCTVLSQLLETVKRVSPTIAADSEKPKLDYSLPRSESTPVSNSDYSLPRSESIPVSKSDYSLPKPDSIPVPKPINKARINEFASLLSSSVHLSQPQPIKKSTTAIKTISSPTHSEEQAFTRVQSLDSDREERESYHTVTSNNSEQEQIKKHIDARYNDKLDDRGSIKIKTANIKALFEQKISDTNKALSQSTEHLLHLTEIKQTHKKIPISYESLKRNLPNYQPVVANNNRRNSFQDSFTMNKFNDHVVGAKDVVIEDKQYENGHGVQLRRNGFDQIVHSTTNSSSNSPVLSTNGHSSESLIAREIRETKEKEEELKRQRKKCGLADDGTSSTLNSANDSMKSESALSANPPVKSSSFLSNLDFFSSKTNGSLNESTSTITSPRRSMVSTQNLIYDSHSSSSSTSLSNHGRQTSNDELKQVTNVVSQELNRFNENGISILRTCSINGTLYRSSSNQNIVSAQNVNNIVQREIEAIRAKEAELRQLGRIQHTSDEHADPRKYQELISILPKSQSISTLSSVKLRRDSDNQHLSRHNVPLTATTNGFLKPKTNNNISVSSIRGKFPSPNPAAPIVSSSNGSNDLSKLSSIDRLELEKRQCQEREQELKKQRNSITACISSTNTTINGDSGNVSQEEHDDDQERYFDKIERIKRKENEKAHAPIIRPTKKLDMSQKWEQMMSNKTDD
ncbi:unnamed protein product [Rotaria magnacalcarata]|uniref:Uncharacterized protein n=11 Tax=Rotaria magnacalcarata TaxID=392030 RepID=A0A816RFJ2_9BILA|nr:unnamed protein product [Rotaria magnacalcarata]